MGYPIEFARKLNFPCIPETFLPDPQKWDFFDYLNGSNFETRLDEETLQANPEDNRYEFWTDDQNTKLNEWCQENICESAYYAFVINNGLKMHKDASEHRGLMRTTTLIYPILTGGETAVTQFWADDKKTLLKEYVFKPYNWYLISGSTYHSVTGISEGKYRLTVTAEMLYQIV